MIGAEGQAGAPMEPEAAPAPDALERERIEARVRAVLALSALVDAAGDVIAILAAPPGPRGTLSEETVPAVVAGDQRLSVAIQATVDALFKVGVIQNAEGIA